MGERTPGVEAGDLAATLGRLAAVIHTRRAADPATSYTARLLSGPADSLIKKLVEEAAELAFAIKDEDHDHIRYEAADLLYHLLVALEKAEVDLAELAGELDARAH